MAASSAVVALAPGGFLVQPDFALPPLLLPLPPDLEFPLPSDLNNHFPLPDFNSRAHVSGTIANVLLVSLSPNTPGLGAQFEGQNLPSISLQDYAERLIRYVDSWAGEGQSPRSTGVSCALVGLIYLGRLNPINLNFRTVHRLFLTAMLCAVKFTEDFRITNRFWAKVGGIDLDEMNRLEIEFLRLIQWNLRVSEHEFAQKLRHFGW
ncbi:hypothetical protein BASA81_003964 [Batrachochytrium salamandrivorans]|nr:hypothetical protein BASA81_003964 [Batrachochytrium salamandrivorans]